MCLATKGKKKSNPKQTNKSNKKPQQHHTSSLFQDGVCVQKCTSHMLAGSTCVARTAVPGDGPIP